MAVGARNNRIQCNLSRSVPTPGSFHLSNVAQHVYGRRPHAVDVLTIGESVCRASALYKSIPPQFQLSRSAPGCTHHSQTVRRPHQSPDDERRGGEQHEGKRGQYEPSRSVHAHASTRALLRLLDSTPFSRSIEPFEAEKRWGFAILAELRFVDSSSSL